MNCERDQCVNDGLLPFHLKQADVLFHLRIIRKDVALTFNYVM